MTQPTTSPFWNVAFCNPRCEFRAHDGLEAKGYDTFLPTYTKLARSGRREYVSERPLFPRYLFVIIPGVDGHHCLDVRQTDGVETLVRHAGSLATVEDELVQALRELDDSGDLADPNLVPPGLEPGDTAKIRSGPAAQHIVKLLSVDDDRRCEVLFEMLGATKPVKMDLANLEPYEYDMAY